MQKRILLERIVISGPCTSGPCLGQVGFDPCEPTDDITERDLEALLKEEAVRYQQKSRLALVSSKIFGLQKAEVNRSSRKKSSGEPENKDRKKSSRGSEKNAPTRSEKNVPSWWAKNTSRRSAKNAPSWSEKNAPRRSEKNASRESEGSEKWEKPSSAEDSKEGKEQATRKRVCKIRKNPFFTNRLKFCSNHATRPPFPPPQHLPLVDDVDSSGRIICPPGRHTSGKKKRRKKKRREERNSDNRQIDLRKISFRTAEKSKSASFEPVRTGSQVRSSQKQNIRGTETKMRYGREGSKGEAEVEEGEVTKRRESKEEIVKGEVTKRTESKEEIVKAEKRKQRESNLETLTGEVTKRKESKKERAKGEVKKRKESKKERAEGEATKGREKEENIHSSSQELFNKSLKQQKPCRKKSPDPSVLWLPGQIPFPQKDLPPMSPRDTSGVQRQILLPYKPPKCQKMEKQKM